MTERLSFYFKTKNQSIYFSFTRNLHNKTLIEKNILDYENKNSNNKVKTSSRRLQDLLQDVFRTSWKTKNCYAEDVLKTNKCLLGLLSTWTWMVKCDKSFVKVRIANFNTSNFIACMWKCFSSFDHYPCRNSYALSLLLRHLSEWSGQLNFNPTVKFQVFYLPK